VDKNLSLISGNAIISGEKSRTVLIVIANKLIDLNISSSLSFCHFLSQKK